MMRLIFVHGWSVTNTSTYGDMPQGLVDIAASNGLELDIQHIQLGKYISFKDEVTLDDIAQAMDRALRELNPESDDIAAFSAITHSTGGPVVRHWVNRFYGSRGLKNMPLQHLVMLAPANHGSALAAIGAKRLGRIKAWFNGVEPGKRVLRWLQLGSTDQWQLNRDMLAYKSAANDYFPFVLTGQGIDTAFYDFLNSYLVESGSDGVVRVAAANVNCRFLTLVQDNGTEVRRDRERSYTALNYEAKRVVAQPQPTPLGVFHGFSHSGGKMGIMAIKSSRAGFDTICNTIIKCLQVNDIASYRQRAAELADHTEKEQLLEPRGKDDNISRYSMLVVRVVDEDNNVVEYDDFDLFLLAGKKYARNALPKGFFVDSQVNKNSNTLVYYLDADLLGSIKDHLWGIQVVVRPEKGFARYRSAEFRSSGLDTGTVFTPNETTYLEIRLQRIVDRNVFQLVGADQPRGKFHKVKPES